MCERINWAWAEIGLEADSPEYANKKISGKTDAVFKIGTLHQNFLSQRLVCALVR